MILNDMSDIKCYVSGKGVTCGYSRRGLARCFRVIVLNVDLEQSIFHRYLMSQLRNLQQKWNQATPSSAGLLKHDGINIGYGKCSGLKMLGT